jgi:medium-chain acyl-[acyl-carrier-protein] hydrolase
MTAVTTPWIAYRKPRPGASVRLFCFPYAGGGASIYREWAAHLGDAVDVCPVQLPGRERRMGETAHTSLPALVRDMARALEGWMELPFAFFGHSMGASIAFELAAHLRDSGRPQPVRLFLSARQGPRVPPRQVPLHLVRDDDAFVRRLAELGAMPPEFLADAELMAFFLPLLRADASLCEVHVPQGPPLAVPVTLLGGTEDADVTADDLRAWGLETASPPTLHLLPGGHFFLHTARKQVLDIVASELGVLQGAC